MSEFKNKAPKRASGPQRNRTNATTNTRDENIDKPGYAARQAASRLLSAVVDAHTPLDALTDNEHGHPQYMALDSRDRSLVRAMVICALRYRRTIEHLINSRLERPLPANARSLSALLHIAAAQILFLDVPDSAAVDIAVTQAKADPRSARFANMVNGVLRNLIRRKERSLPAVLNTVLDAPDWFIDRLTAAYGPEQTAEILKAQRREAATDFSVKSDAQGWAEKFGGRVLPNGSVRIDRLSMSVTELPGYDEGEWWVQDAAASLPARLLGEVRGLDVADLCAAPGGKTAGLVVAGANVTAVDQSRNRLKRLKQNLERLKLSADVVQADILKWQPDKKFDAILLDAPCSSTGTVRRHPDVPWSKTTEDVAKLATLQRRLLEKSLSLLKPGGTLVFANCSLDPEEGEDLVRAFLTDHPDVKIIPIRAEELPGASHFIAPEGWLRTIPQLDEDNPERLSGIDGFFAVRFSQAKQ